MKRAAQHGFTLIEVMGVILVTTILLAVAINFFVNLSRQATRASENTREVRRAATILDRIAADLEHAILVSKPAERDPLAHPWVFFAESRYGEGADRPPVHDSAGPPLDRRPRRRPGPGGIHAPPQRRHRRRHLHPATLGRPGPARRAAPRVPPRRRSQLLRRGRRPPLLRLPVPRWRGQLAHRVELGAAARRLRAPGRRGGPDRAEERCPARRRLRLR